MPATLTQTDLTATKKRELTARQIAAEAADATAFAAACEAAYRQRIEALCGEILAQGLHIVMLTGASAAGKTTSAHKLCEAVAAHGLRSAVISLDDFYVGEGRYPKRPDGTDDYECLEALDLPLLRDCMTDLHQIGCCTAPLFDFKTQMPAGSHRVDCRGGVVIIEGLHALNPALAEALPAGAVLRVYAGLREEYRAPDGTRLNTRDIRLARRLVRDYRTRNHGAEFTLNLWPGVCEGEKKYIAPYKKQADAMLDTGHRYEICLWKQQLAALPVHDDAAARALERLRAEFDAYPALDAALVPKDSMLREFME